MNKINIKIDGMDCASCSAKIERTLEKTSGITKANVNLATGKAMIEYEDEHIKSEKILDIIKNFGYKPKLDNNDSEGSQFKKIEAEVTQLRNNFLISLVIFLPLFYLVLSGLFGLPAPALSLKQMAGFQFLVATAIMILNRQIYVSGLVKLWKRNPNMDSLIETGTLAAYLYSLVLAIMVFLNKPITGSYLYFDSAAAILVFVALGKFLEARARGKTSEAIKKLMILQPSVATIIKRNNEKIKAENFFENENIYIEETIKVSELELNDILSIKPGEKIPIDGLVIGGYSGVDEKMLTGESMPVEKKINNKVIGGTINLNGHLFVKVLKLGDDTMLAQIIKIVDNALSSKAEIQRFADQVSYYFVPALFAISILALASWLIAGMPFVFALTIFISVLIVACPCTMGLATPTAIMMGSGLAAQNGILIKNAHGLELAQKVDTFVFDKTGTITKGKPVVTDVLSIDENIIKNQKIIQIAATLESRSEHPLANSILKKAEEEKISLLNCVSFNNLPGLGIKAKIENENTETFFGNIRLATQLGLVIDEKIGNAIKKFESEGKTVMILGQEKNVFGIIAVADTLKDNIAEVMDELKSMNKEIIILTGDNKLVGEVIAKKAGIGHVLAEVLPQDKAKVIELLQGGLEIDSIEKSLKIENFKIENYLQRRVVAMVGDGINDAPALATADLGIAVGTGTDIAIEAGEVILIKDDLQYLVKFIKLSEYTLKKIKQNLFWAFFYNIIAIPIAAGVLYPFTDWIMRPEIGAAAMAFSSVSVVLNSLSMKKYRV